NLGKTRDLAQAYTEAIEREHGPRRLELQVLLGQTQLKLGEADLALQQAKLVLDMEKNRPDALLLQARALADAGTTMSEKAARHQEAVKLLEDIIKANPSFREAYQALAEVHLKHRHRTKAITVLKQALRAHPDNATAMEQLMQLLAERRPGGQPAAAADLDEA